jgi:peptidoglycan/LPS O-acetylase OafA/YrhL
LGSIAVCVFFLISGYLIAGSLEKSPGIIFFLFSRFLRIFPGLFVMMIFVVFVLGPALADGHYLDWQVLNYFLKGVTLVFGVEYYLKNIFSLNPYPGVLNGSLWSLPFEVYCYILLAFAYFVFIRLLRCKIIYQMCVMLAFFVLYAAYLLENNVIYFSIMMFCLGVCVHVFQRNIDFIFNLNLWRFLVIFIASCLLAVLNLKFFLVVLPFVLVYFVFYFGLNFYKISSMLQGDYSYGIYLYSFPLQQLFISELKISDPLLLMVLSLFASLLFAVFSWVFVESWFLSLKSYYRKFIS